MVTENDTKDEKTRADVIRNSAKVTLGVGVAITLASLVVMFTTGFDCEFFLAIGPGFLAAAGWLFHQARKSAEKDGIAETGAQMA